MNGVAFLLVLAALVPSVSAQMAVQISGSFTYTQFGMSPGSTVGATYPVTGGGTYGWPGVLNASLGTTTSLVVTSQASGWYSVSSVADLRLHYAANAPLAGVLRFTGTSGLASFQALVRVDVDGDSQFEVLLTTAQSSAVVDVPVVLGPRSIPVDVDIRVQSSVPGQALASSVTVQFLPNANLTTSGVACDSRLTASMRKPTVGTDGRLWLHVDDAPTPASVVGAVLVGSTALPMGATCGQGLIDDALVLVNPATGVVDLPVALSPALLGSVNLQYVGLQLPGQLRWSNRIELTLP